MVFMKRAIYLAPIMMVMAFAACMTNAPVSQSESGQVVQASTVAAPVQPPRKYLHKGEKLPAQDLASVGITVYGSCSTAFCDGDWNDVQNVSFVSCSNGSCSADNYWICGGPCEPETTSCSCSDL
jgi:hypothetical protein